MPKRIPLSLRLSSKLLTDVKEVAKQYEALSGDLNLSLVCRMAIRRGLPLLASEFKTALETRSEKS